MNGVILTNFFLLLRVAGYSKSKSGICELKSHGRSVIDDGNAARVLLSIRSIKSLNQPEYCLRNVQDKMNADYL